MAQKVPSTVVLYLVLQEGDAFVFIPHVAFGNEWQLLTEWVLAYYVGDLRAGSSRSPATAPLQDLYRLRLTCLFRQESSRRWFRFLASVDGAQDSGSSFQALCESGETEQMLAGVSILWIIFGRQT